MFKKLLFFWMFLTTMVGNITAETVGKVGTSGGALNTTDWSVENEDTWDDYLTQFSTEQTLTEGKTIHYVFTQTSIGVTNWRGWVLVVKSNGNNYRLIRQDNWEDKEGSNSRCSNDYNWTDFAANMNGANVDMYVTLINGNLKMTSIVTDKNGAHYYYSYVQPTTEKSFTICLSVNRAYLNITKTETLNDAYTVSKATLDHTASTYFNDSNEDIRYSHNAEKEHYRYYYDHSGTSFREGFAFAQFSYNLTSVETVTSANLLWSYTDFNKGGGSGSYNHNIYYLNSGISIDYAAIDNQTSGVLKYQGQKSVANDTYNSGNTSGDVNSDVTSAVAAQVSDGQIIFQWATTRSAANAGVNLYGKGSQYKFPVLKIVKKEAEKVKTQAKLWDFTDWTTTQAQIEAISDINNENHYRHWENKGGEAQGTFKSVAWSSSGIPEADGLWFGSKDASTVSFRVKVGTDGYIRPITQGGTISIPVQAGQIVTISAYPYESNKSSNYTLRSVQGDGTTVNEINGNFPSATDVIYQAQTDGYVDFTWRSGTYPCIQKIRVDKAPGFQVNNTIVQTIPQQTAELIYLDFNEPELVIPNGATVTYTSSNYRIAYCPSTASQTLPDGTTWPGEAAGYVGEVRFVGTGLVGITCNVTYGGYSWPLTYNVLVRADEASMGSVGNEYSIYAHNIDTSKNILTTGGKLANRVVRLRSITAEFGPSDVFNTTIVRAITGNPVGSHTVGMTTLATNGWRDAYFQDSSNPKKPTQGTFYKFVPKANGTLTVKGYVASSGVPAIMVDATNGYSQVGDAIAWTNNSTLTTATFTLLKDHEYYLFGVNPNYPDYGSYSNGNNNSWATYQLVSFSYDQSFKIVTTKATQYLKDNNNNYIQTSSVVVPRNVTTYTANFEGASQNVTARAESRGNISGATVTVTNSGNGKGNIKVDWNAVGSGEGGAIIVIANDGTDIYYTITVPYDVKTWDMQNYQSNVDKQIGGADLLDWNTTYEVRNYNDQTRALTYLNNSILTSHNSMAYDNAVYVGQTAGLVVESSGSSFGLAYDAPNELDEYVAAHQTDGKIADTNGDGKITKDDLDEAKIDEILRSMLNHVYTAADIQTANVGAMDKGAYLTIPSLTKGQHVAIKWYRHAPNSGEWVHVYNAHNLKKWIDGEEYTSSDPSELDVFIGRQSGSSNIFNARYGWLEFVVANDGDVTFHVTDNGFTHIKKITISEVGEEIDADMALRTGSGNTGHTANTFYYNKNEAGVSQQFSNTDGNVHGQITLSGEFRLREIKGTFPRITITSGDGTYTYTPNSSVKGLFKSPAVNYSEDYSESFDGSVAYINGAGGLLTVEGGQGTFYIEQIAYSNNNAVEYQKTLIHVLETGSVTQDYPYTWDFTNITAETKQSVTQNNDNWTGTNGNYTFSGTGQSNFVMGTDLTTTGGAENESTGSKKLSEYDGLGFLAQPAKMTNIHITFPDGNPETPSHGNAPGLLIGNDEVTTLVVPKVPAGMTVYVRTGDGNVSTAPFYVSMSGEKDGKPDDQTPTVITDDYGNSENVYTFNTNTNEQDVYIDVQNVTVKAIAVSKFTKRCWFKNEIPGDSKEGYYYNTDSHDKPIDYTLTKYFTGKDIQAYSINAFNPTESSVALSYVYKAPANTGYVVETQYENDVVEKLPLFVPCVNDQLYGMTELGGCADYLQPHVPSGRVDTSDPDYYYYILTNMWYNINTGSSDNMTQASVPGFYRLYEQSSEAQNTLTNNRAVLRLPKSIVDGTTGTTSGVKQFIPLFKFNGDIVDAIDTVSEEVNESVIDMNGTFYTLQGMKVEGFPKKSGIYMQNGKKILVK